MEMQVKSACGSVLQIITKKVPNLSFPGVQIGAHNFKKKWKNRARFSRLASCISESPKIILYYDFVSARGPNWSPEFQQNMEKSCPSLLVGSLYLRVSENHIWLWF